MATRRKILLDLPLEIVHNICDDMRNPKDLLALGLTHRRFTHVACDRHLNYMKIEAPVTHYDFWKYAERVPAFRARARELTLSPASPSTILIPSIPPAIFPMIPAVVVPMVPSPTLPVGPSTITSASSSSTPIPSSGSAENQDYAQEAEEESQEDQTQGQVQAAEAAEVEEEPTPDKAIKLFFQTLTQLRELQSLRVEHCSLPQELRDEHFMLVEQMLTSISSAAHFDTLELWDGAYTPELQRSRMPILANNGITNVSIDFTITEARDDYPEQFLISYLIHSCPLLSKLEISFHHDVRNILRLLFSGSWSALTHLSIFERNPIVLDEDMAVNYELDVFLRRHLTVTHLFLSISASLLSYTVPFNSATNVTSFGIHLDGITGTDAILLPDAHTPSKIQHLVFLIVSTFDTKLSSPGLSKVIAKEFEKPRCGSDGISKVA
ncbi:hypothetical protein M422DRAFT_239635 [Sphaerobolus stellatus SS14]|nr:hypothetical protein M422DRAFT_239635 [Sphaerobolus stellatus SS14]